MKKFFLIGSFTAFLAVALGAFGAHGLEGQISDKMLEIWKTGVTYEMFQTGGLFVVGFLLYLFPKCNLLNWAGWLMVLGMILFSGSLYVLSVTGITVLGIITPFGGVAFLVAWILVGVSVWRNMD